MKILAKKRLLSKRYKERTIKTDINGFGPKTAAYVHKIVQKTNASLPKRLVVNLAELRKEFKYI